VNRPPGYRDRAEAGGHLADLVVARGYLHPVVLALVRGGVPVAVPVARALGVALDVLVVRKLGVPWLPEVAFGALGPGGVRVLNPSIADRLDPIEIAEVTEAEAAELVRREQLYRPGRPPPRLAGHTALLVDDGLATGATARAAVRIARDLGADRVVLAAPVGAEPAVAGVEKVADEVICPLVPADFSAVSRFYDTFPQVTDDEVRAALAAAAR
jgi:putative phosphoribosyl transferase